MYSILSEDIHGIQSGNYTPTLQNALNYSKQIPAAKQASVRIPPLLPSLMYNRLLTIIPSLSSYISIGNPNDVPTSTIPHDQHQHAMDETITGSVVPSSTSTTTVSSSKLASPLRIASSTTTNTIPSTTTPAILPPSTPLIHQVSSSSITTPASSSIPLGRSNTHDTTSLSTTIGQPLLLQSSSIMNDPALVSQYETSIKEWIKTKILELFDTLIKHRTKDLFLYPVTRDEAPDYFDIITNPMDYTTLRTLIDKNQVNTLEEFNTYVELIINNCKLYNSPNNTTTTSSSSTVSTSITDNDTTVGSNRKNKKKLENYYEWAVQLENHYKPIYEKALDLQARERLRIITRLTASTVTSQRKHNTTNANTPLQASASNTSTTTGKKRGRAARTVDNDTNNPSVGIRSGNESVIDSEIDDNTTEDNTNVNKNLLLTSDILQKELTTTNKDDTTTDIPSNSTGRGRGRGRSSIGGRIHGSNTNLKDMIDDGEASVDKSNIVDTNDTNNNDEQESRAGDDDETTETTGKKSTRKSTKKITTKTEGGGEGPVEESEEATTTTGTRGTRGRRTSGGATTEATPVPSSTTTTAVEKSTTVRKRKRSINDEDDDAASTKPDETTEETTLSRSISTASSTGRRSTAKRNTVEEENKGETESAVNSDAESSTAPSTGQRSRRKSGVAAVTPVVSVTKPGNTTTTTTTTPATTIDTGAITPLQPPPSKKKK